MRWVPIILIPFQALGAGQLPPAPSLFPALPQSAPQNAPPLGQYPVCDVAFESTVCFFNQEHVLLPDARPYGMVGHYTFDMVKVLDSSGHRNHAMGDVLAGPPWGPSGASGMFRKNYVVIPHSTTHETTDYSITFWIYRLEDQESKTMAAAAKRLERWCPVVHKGVQEIASTTGAPSLESQPGILVDPVTGHVKVTVSTREVAAAQGEFLTSNFRLLPHGWNHVAVIRHLTRLRVYINGILDSTMKTIGTSRSNTMPYYIGAAPWTESICDLPILMDELKIYGIPIGRDQIQAEAAAALPGIEPSALYLSCVDCARLQAEEGCPEGFHLCTKLELMMGGYTVLKRMGIVSSQAGTHVFTGEASIEALRPPRGGGESKQEPATGVGLCCRDSV